MGLLKHGGQKGPDLGPGMRVHLDNSLVTPASKGVTVGEIGGDGIDHYGPWYASVLINNRPEVTLGSLEAFFSLG